MSTPLSGVRLLAVVVVVAFGVGACGDDGDEAGTSRGSVTSSAVPTDDESVETPVEEGLTSSTADDGEADETTIGDEAPSTAGTAEITVGTSSPGASAPPPTTTAGSGTQDAEAVVPEGFRAVTITVTSADGTIHEWCVWLAETVAERSRGLMEATGLGGADGMMFAYEREVQHNFWMANTPLPLSIAYFDRDGAYISSTDMEPCVEDDLSGCERYAAPAPYQYALEVPRGDLAALGIGEGSQVERHDEPASDSCEPM